MRNAIIGVAAVLSAAAPASGNAQIGADVATGPAAGTVNVVSPGAPVGGIAGRRPLRPQLCGSPASAAPSRQSRNRVMFPRSRGNPQDEASCQPNQKARASGGGT